MDLSDLLFDCFRTVNAMVRFVTKAVPDGSTICGHTGDPAPIPRAHELAEHLRGHGYAKRVQPLYEKLLDDRPARGPDIAATFFKESGGERLTWSTQACETTDALDWAPLRAAMAPSLGALLGFAARDARTRGFATISTSEVFRVYRAMQPWIAAVFPDDRLLEAAALEGDAASNLELVFDENAKLGASACLRKTVRGLLALTARTHAISEHDIFFDLARFGGGESAKRLIQTPEEFERLNQLSRILRLGRITRHAVLDEGSDGPQPALKER